VWVGRRRGALGRVALVSLGVTAGVWGAGIALMSTGWKDIDGWIDCHDHCHAWHRTGAFLVWTPLLVGVMLVVVLAAVAVLASRSRAGAL
jgi:hypothetical protein